MLHIPPRMIRSNFAHLSKSIASTSNLDRAQGRLACSFAYASPPPCWLQRSHQVRDRLGRDVVHSQLFPGYQMRRQAIGGRVTADGPSRCTHGLLQPHGSHASPFMSTLQRRQAATGPISFSAGLRRQDATAVRLTVASELHHRLLKPQSFDTK